MASRAIENAARDVVERTRAGDQVAMALLARVRDNAKSGDPKARKSLKAIERYIRKHPPRPNHLFADVGRDVPSVGPVSDITQPGSSEHSAAKALWLNPTPAIVLKAIPCCGFWAGAVALKHGPRLDSARIHEISEAAPEEARPALQNAIRFWRKKAPDDANDVQEQSWLIGRIIGLARCLQRLQLPSVPISSLCPIAGWELGE